MSSVPTDSLSKEQQDELLCTYAALILHDDGAEINTQTMSDLIKASGCTVEAYWPMLMCKMISNVGMDELLKMGGGGGGGGGGEAAAAPAAAADAGGDAGGKGGKKAAKKEEVEEEEEAMDFDLFG
mmetsp:Transcript_62136/g.134921  ORF Transcript_62136/g.134921 Transcript_62136/m.134921 type:complete len:126 (-) Transcript_62136:81-458(-)